MARKPKKLTDHELVAACRFQSSRASGSETSADELTASRTNALKYYMGKPRGDEVDGDSAVISMDVADTVHAMLAEMMPTFNTDSIILFEPEDEQDEKQALIESKYVNYQIMQRNRGNIVLQTALKDAMLSKNGVVKVYVDEQEDIDRERYTGLTELEMVEVMQPRAENQIIDITKFDEKKGDINLKRITTTRKLMVTNVPPERFKIASQHWSPFVKDSPYCAEILYKTRSDLIKEGFKAAMVMDLPRATVDTKVDSVERNQIQDEQNFFAATPEMEMLELEEHYIKIDYDGDGIAELRRVLTCESVLIETEEVDCIPYVSGVIILMGHRFHGMSVYELLKNIQDSKTHFLRQWHNNAYASNHASTDVVENSVNMEDFTNGRAAGIRRVDSLDSCRQNPVNDVGPSISLALEYMDKIRTERVGSALDFQTNQVKTPHNVGDQGVNTILANLEQISEWMLGTFAETFVSELALLVHKYMRKYFPNSMSRKIGGQWQPTNPQEWREREQVGTALGLTKGQRLRRAIALEKVVAKQEQLILGGHNGVLADMEGYYAAMTDYCRMSGVDNPEKYFIDPSSQQSHQAAQSNQAMQEQQKQEQMQLQKDLIQTQILEIQRNWENDRAELQHKYDELEYKYNELAQRTEVEEAKIVGGAVEKLNLRAIDAKSGREAAKTEQGSQ